MFTVDQFISLLPSGSDPFELRLQTEGSRGDLLVMSRVVINLPDENCPKGLVIITLRPPRSE